MYQGANYGLLKGITLSGILDGTTKTLNIVNQIIPIFNQIKPLIGNAQTLFKISNIMKNDKPAVVSEVNDDKKSNISQIFFV